MDPAQRLLLQNRLNSLRQEHLKVLKEVSVKLLDYVNQNTKPSTTLLGKMNAILAKCQDILAPFGVEVPDTRTVLFHDRFTEALERGGRRYKSIYLYNEFLLPFDEYAEAMKVQRWLLAAQPGVQQN